MITNRLKVPDNNLSWNQIVPVSGAGLWWYLAPGSYNPNYKNYESQSSITQVTAPPSFQTALLADLKTQGKNARLTVYIHGLGNVWGTQLLSSDAVLETATFGQWLGKQGFGGLLIGFSWPCYSAVESLAHYASTSTFPPSNKSGTIRDNINGSRQSFQSLMNFLQNLVVAAAKANGQILNISFVCHSEGNYVMMLGMYQLTCEVVDQILLIAADVNNAALQVPGTDPNVGWGSFISENANRVTVYSSVCDPTLCGSVVSFSGFHNQEFGGRLGIDGPSYNYGSQQPSSVGVDCALVVNEQNVTSLCNNGTIPQGTDLHSSYRYIPQVLDDIIATINGAPSNGIENRSPTKNTSSYLMNLMDSAKDK
jgi:esterase/lipase superfamily enzyme